jgi:uncharacterized protein (TIRG00374 family)
VPIKEKKQKTIKISIIISLVLSISITILILYFTIDLETIEYITSRNIRYEFFLIAILVSFIYWLCWGARLRILCNAIDKKFHISIWESTKIVLANLFLANITPSLAGGEPIRIYLLNKDGLNIGSATASVLGERLLDAVFLIICFPFAFFVFRTHIESGPLSIALTIAIGIFILAVFLFVYALRYPEKIKSFLIYLNNKISKLRRKKENENSIIEKINCEVDNFHDSMVFFLSKGRKAFLKAGFTTAAFWIIGWIIPPLILMGLGLGPHIIESTAAQILLIIIVMMPTTPGSAGVSEGGAAALYSIFIDSSFIGIFILLFRLATYHMGLIVGAIFQYRIFKSVASFSMDTLKKQY